MYGYIYLIVNNVNGHTYVGKHKLNKKKWNEDKYMGSGVLVRTAQKKYGIDNFEKFLITYTSSEEDACEKEKFWIAHYRSLGKAEYNETAGGDGLINPSLAVRQKLSEVHKGKHHSDETRKKMSLAHKGKIFSEETRKKLSEANRGKKMLDETRKKIAETLKEKPVRHWKGKHFSEEHKRHLSEAKKGKPAWNKGRNLSEETKRKISEAQKKRLAKENIGD